MCFLGGGGGRCRDRGSGMEYPPVAPVFDNSHAWKPNIQCMLTAVVWGEVA